ncbi:MAG: hypothetical protein FJX56_11210 [Alphaproteobacteria bacterium]|nr:hypothetical protein [Alphaproteobacteria bacterium]
MRRLRYRLDATEIAAVDQRIDGWRSLSQDESAAAIRVAKADGTEPEAPAVATAYVPPEPEATLPEGDTGYVLPPDKPAAERSTERSTPRPPTRRQRPTPPRGSKRRRSTIARRTLAPTTCW